MNTPQKILFFRRLALYLNAGISIIHGISFIIEDTTSQKAEKMLMRLQETLAAGKPLSSALAEFPKQFNSFMIGFIQIGETSGNLSETLKRLAILLHRQNTLQRKIVSALAYPALVFCGTISITLFLIIFIFPKIVPVLRGLKTALPFTTQVLIETSQFTESNWWMLLVLTGVLILMCSIGIRYKQVRRSIEHVVLRIPLLRTLLQYYIIATFSRTLSLQLKGGIHILPALELVRRALPGTLYSEALTQVENQITNGQRFSEAVRTQGKLFPILVYQMISVGESTGTLSLNLETLADLYEDNLDELAKNLTTLIEPALMVFMGFIVGFVALAIITPIYAVTQNLNTQ